MMDRLENIDELFREGLKNYSVSPPSELWQKIELDLSKSRKKNLFPVFLRVAAGIALLLSVSWLVWKFNKAPQQQQIAESSPTEIQSADTPSDILPAGSALLVKEFVDPQPKADGKHPKQESTPASVYADKQHSSETSAETPVTGTFFVTGTSDSLREIHESVHIPEVRASYDVAFKPDPLQKPQSSGTVTQESIISQNLLAIESQQDINKRNRTEWSLGGQVGPQYTYRDVVVNAPASPVRNFDDFETGTIAYAGGLQVAVAPLSRLSFQSGVHYSKMGQVRSSVFYNNQYSGTGSIWDNSPDMRDEDLPDYIVNSTSSFDKLISPQISSPESEEVLTKGNIMSEQYYEFVEIPFVVRYILVDKKLNVNLSSGLWANILIGNKEYQTDNATFSRETEPNEAKSLAYSASLSVGLEYPLAQKIYLNLEPFFKYYLSPINTNPETDVYPYSIGVMTGVRYRF